MGARARDRGKVVAPKYVFIGGDVINPVLEFVRRGYKIGIQFIDVGRDVARVNEPAKTQAHKAEK